MLANPDYPVHFLGSGQGLRGEPVVAFIVMVRLVVNVRLAVIALANPFTSG